MQVKIDTFRLDTNEFALLSDDAIPSTITYTARDSTPMDMETRMVYLYKEGVVMYEDIELRADHMEVDLENKTVYARGVPDSTGTIVGKPVFKQGADEYECDELTYNFDTGKGIMKNIITEQEGGFLHSEATKRQADGELHNAHSKYTTCDKEHPDFYVALTRAKAIPNEKIISGPAYLVVADIPLPFILPFGYFPYEKSKSSGILMPTYGEEKARGFYLREGGYYFAMNDYFDLALRGSAYTNGTWMAGFSSNYKLRYRYTGNLGFEYANNVNGRKGIDYSRSYNYRVRWSHSQDAKANPGTRFSASVNMSSSGFDRENEYDLEQYVTNTKSSSISYSKNWTGTPFNLSTSLNHSQNTRNQTVSVNLPKATFTVQRLFPFKREMAGGKKKWYEEIQLQYTANVDNRIRTTDSLLFTNAVFEDMDFGFQHTVPISLTLRPFRNFNITPNATYTGVMYARSIAQKWDAGYTNPETGEVTGALIRDTIGGLHYGHALVPRLSASYSNKLFGFFEFKPDAKVKAIRHVLMTNVGFSYVPYWDFLAGKMYKTTQINQEGDTREYSIYEGGIFGTPSLSSQSGSVSFALNNIIEAKVRDDSDTTRADKKISLIDNLNFSTGYNLFADSLNWSPVNFRGSTRVLNNKININFNGTLNPYGIMEDSLGVVRTVNQSALNVNNSLFRLTKFTLSFSASLQSKGSSSSAGNTGGQREGFAGGGMRGESLMGPGEDRMMPAGDPMGEEMDYAPWGGSWNLRVNYNLSYRKNYFEPTFTQTLRFSGGFRPTPKWSVTLSSGVDLESMKLTPSRLNFSRDLHCWEMNLSWSPIGRRQYWMFTLRAKASILQDLKYEKKQDFRDSAEFF